MTRLRYRFARQTQVKFRGVIEPAASRMTAVPRCCASGEPEVPRRPGDASPQTREVAASLQEGGPA
jgi:hypothetical protein